jgi:phosphoesterase RecJ-like protein
MKNIAHMLMKYNDIALITHVTPDGDAIASSFGLAIALKSLGKRRDVLR